MQLECVIVCLSTYVSLLHIITLKILWFVYCGQSVVTFAVGNVSDRYNFIMRDTMFPDLFTDNFN